MSQEGVSLMIKVLLVEDQQLFREGVNALVSAEEDMEVIGMTHHGLEAIQQIEEQQPDVILMDIHMPEVNGIKATSQIKEHYPNIKVILLTTNKDIDLITTGLSVGADGFLLKTLDASRLVRSIRDAYDGQIVLSGEVAKMLATKVKAYKYDKKEILGEKLVNLDIQLSRRELDIAYLLKEEITNKNIAQELFLSEGTVKNYISEIYNKLGLRNRKDVIDYLRGL